MGATPSARINPRAEYARRLADRAAALARGERRAVRLSNGRLLTAGVALVVLWGAVVRDAWSPVWILVPAVLFAGLAVIHARLLGAQDRLRRAHALYERGLRRIDGTWAEAAGPTADDLDLFGPGSLFELLDTTRTEVGAATLGQWLRTPASIDEVVERQAAVAELRDLPDFREALAVLAAEAEVGRTDRLAAWASEPPAAFRRAVPILFAAASAVTACVAFAIYLDRLELAWLGLWLIVESVFALPWARRLERIVAAVGTPDHDLGLLSALLETIERQPFTSARLMALRESLASEGAPPSVRIHRLRKLVSAIDATHNLLFAPVAYSVLLRQQLAMAVDRWHQRHRLAVLEWLRRVGEIEALAALATFAYEHPADPFPEVTAAAPAVFEASALAHPLMPEATAVRNDVALGGRHPQVLIVSGSNMSGKSTLLRAVGINAVLALAGATVRASRLTMTRVMIGATIRVDDSLQEGRSRFYAEILRIRDIVQHASSGPTLFLLDEILHGTNSYDRRIGAEAIVVALVNRGAIGLVTTHDLALTELSSKLGTAENVHFEDRLEDGRMVFDYRIHPGVVEHSNALALMRAVGLDV